MRSLDSSRLDWVEDQIYRLLQPRRVIEREFEKKFGLKARQCRNYIRAVRDRWEQHRSANVEQIRSELDSGLRTLYVKAFQEGDNRSAVAAIRELKSLHGVDQPATIKHEVAGALAFAGETDPEKALQRLQELRQAQEKKPEGDK